MNVQQNDKVWPAEYVKTLPPASFLFTQENGAHLFPYRNAEGEISLPNLRKALIAITASHLDERKKSKTLERARIIAKGAGINLSEEFIDEAALRGPLFMPYLYVTLEQFNSGELLGESVTKEEYDAFGSRLAATLNKSITVSSSYTEYDDEGRLSAYGYDSETESEWEWVYRDGSIVRTKASSACSSDEETEYDVVSGNTENVMESTLHAGDTIKMLRGKKKLTRYNMAANMKITADRLKEIEETGEYSDDEIEEIAGALGVTKKRIERMTQYMGLDESAKKETRFIEIESETQEDEPETEPEQKTEEPKQELEAKKEDKPALVLYEQVEERAVKEFGGQKKKIHRLTGLILTEEKREDGTIKFKVPMFKIGEYTANGNRYMMEFAENLIGDIQRLRESRSRSDYGSAKRSVLDIDVYEEVPDMQATHDPRVGKGNDILSCAGEVLGGEIGEVDGDPTFFLLGETIPTQAGKDVTVQILREMIRGVSHVTVPTKYEENKKNGYDVFRGHIIGADFTKNPANQVQFTTRTAARFQIA